MPLNHDSSEEHHQATAATLSVLAGRARMKQKGWATAASDDTWTVLR
jgi:hypothetical protein